MTVKLIIHHSDQISLISAAWVSGLDLASCLERRACVRDSDRLSAALAAGVTAASQSHPPQITKADPRVAYSSERSQRGYRGSDVGGKWRDEGFRRTAG